MDCAGLKFLTDVGSQAILLLTLLLPLLALGCAVTPGARHLRPYREVSPDDVDRLLLLRNDRIEVGLLPRVGGRIVLLRRPGGRNVLCSDPALWHTGKEPVPEPSPDGAFKEYRGHIVWAGPQSEFWGDQDFAPERREEESVWPPDPFLTYGEFRVVEHGPGHVRLVGPESPVCGLQLTKEVRLRPGTRMVDLSVTGTNARERPVSKDLWSNTRLPGTARCYVPVEPEARVVRIDAPGPDSGDQIALGHEVVNGYFTFRCRETIPAGKSARRAKAFIAEAGLIAAFVGGDLFLKTGTLVETELVHPKQAGVEVYNIVHRDPVRSLLELEMHGPFWTLQPGESMTFEETWELVPYGGEDDPAEQTAFLTDSLQIPF